MFEKGVFTKCWRCAREQQALLRAMSGLSVCATANGKWRNAQRLTSPDREPTLGQCSALLARSCFLKGCTPHISRR